VIHWTPDTTKERTKPARRMPLDFIFLRCNRACLMFVCSAVVEKEKVMTDLCALPVYCTVLFCMPRPSQRCHVMNTSRPIQRQIHPTGAILSHPTGSGHPQLAFSWIARVDLYLWTVSQYSTAASFFLQRTSYSSGSYHIRGMIALHRLSYTKTPNN
jgi:hypothetical protein